MFNIGGSTFDVVQILDPANYPGAEYFNWFFTLIMIWGLFCFGLKVLCDLINRS